MEMPLRGVPADRGAHVQSEPRTFEAFYWSVHRPLFGAPASSPATERTLKIFQEAFLRVWERWNRVALIDNSRGFPVSDGDEHLRTVASGQARLASHDGQPDPRDELAEVEDRDFVERALRPLTPRERAAVVLTCYVGLTSRRGWPGLGIRSARCEPHGCGPGGRDEI